MSLTLTGSNVLKTLGTYQSVSEKSCVMLGDNYRFKGNGPTKGSKARPDIRIGEARAR